MPLGLFCLKVLPNCAIVPHAARGCPITLPCMVGRKNELFSSCCEGVILVRVLKGCDGPFSSSRRSWSNCLEGFKNFLLFNFNTVSNKLNKTQVISDSATTRWSSVFWSYVSFILCLKQKCWLGCLFHVLQIWRHSGSICAIYGKTDFNFYITNVLGSLKSMLLILVPHTSMLLEKKDFQEKNKSAFRNNEQDVWKYLVYYPFWKESSYSVLS